MKSQTLHCFNSSAIFTDFNDGILVSEEDLVSKKQLH